MTNKYIHYGHKEFRRDWFQPIKNDPEGLGSKPVGGLWASNVLAECGWKWWCEDTNFRECSEENSFTFSLKEDANVLRIESIKDLESLPKCKSLLAEQLEVNIPWVLLDFEALQKSGVDAIEVDMNMGLYFALYGWDCDCILVMDPDVIVTEGEKTGDEGRGSPKSEKLLEEMTGVELGNLFVELLEKPVGVDADMIKAAIREVNRREAAEAVELDDAIENYKRRVGNREPVQIAEAERLELMEDGLVLLERIDLRQAANLGVKKLLILGAIDEYEAADLIGVERLVKRVFDKISRDIWK